MKFRFIDKWKLGSLPILYPSDADNFRRSLFIPTCDPSFSTSQLLSSKRRRELLVVGKGVGTGVGSAVGNSVGKNVVASKDIEAFGKKYKLSGIVLYMKIGVASESIEI